MPFAPQWTLSVAAIAAATALTGCSARNYDFTSPTPSSPSVSTNSGLESQPRAAQLAADLDQLTGVHPDDESLYDLKLLPLLHSELHVFAENDDADSPAAFIEADLASCLPLFAFVNGQVREYDANHQLLTEYAFDSSLWGMFRTHHETIMTPAGPEETTKETYFWLFTHETQ